MKIGINALFLQSPATGSGQYLIHLLKALAHTNSQHEFLLLGAKPIEKSERQDSVGEQLSFPYQAHPVPRMARHSENIEKLLWEQLTGPAAARKAQVDLFHIPYFAPPLVPRTPTVVTIHDVIPLRLPLYRAGARVEAYTRLVARAAHSATLVITVSQHAKQDMIDALKLPAERIRVIYEAAAEEYQPISDSEKLAQVRTRYGVGENYILCISGLDQRKNIPQLVRAFAQLYKQLQQPDLQLLITGDPDKQKGPLFPDPRPIAAALGVAERIVYRFIEEEDKPAMCSGARLFVFPSLYEGFGLPPLEAMNCGTPVVCSNRTSLPEVVGDAALSVDPDDIGALVAAMHSVLTDSTLCSDLRARSLQRAAQFSWHKTASETLAAYEEALARSKK